MSKMAFPQQSSQFPDKHLGWFFVNRVYGCSGLDQLFPEKISNFTAVQIICHGELID